MEYAKGTWKKIFNQIEDYSTEDLTKKKASLKRTTPFLIGGVILILIITIWKMMERGAIDFTLMIPLGFVFLLIHHMEYNKAVNKEIAKRF